MKIPGFTEILGIWLIAVDNIAKVKLYENLLLSETKKDRSRSDILIKPAKFNITDLT